MALKRAIADARTEDERKYIELQCLNAHNRLVARFSLGERPAIPVLTNDLNAGVCGEVSAWMDQISAA